MNAGAGNDGGAASVASAGSAGSVGRAERVFKLEGMGVFLGQRIKNKNRRKISNLFLVLKNYVRFPRAPVNSRA